jgi:hypothetical protein
MDVSPIIAAGGNGSGDFVVGLLVGCCIGILVGPAFRSWQIYKEWVLASREARLADRLLDRMELDTELDDWTALTEADDSTVEPTWRTRP